MRRGVRRVSLEEALALVAKAGIGFDPDTSPRTFDRSRCGRVIVPYCSLGVVRRPEQATVQREIAGSRDF